MSTFTKLCIAVFVLGFLGHMVGIDGKVTFFSSCMVGLLWGLFGSDGNDN